MRQIRKYLGIGVLAIVSLAGCNLSENIKKDILKRNMPEANGYDVLVSYIPGKELRIGTYDHGFEMDKDGLIIAIDKNRDGRVDNIDLIEIKKGSPLEEIASAVKINEILNAAEEKH